MLRVIYDWSEVWALLISLFYIYKAKGTPVYLKPVKAFVWISLILNLAQMIIWYRLKLHLPEFPAILQSNTFIYNLLSATRLITFSLFFILLGQHFMPRIKKNNPFWISLIHDHQFYFLRTVFFCRNQ